MVINTKFWILLAVFELVFGLAVFAITRHYYTADVNTAAATRTSTSSRPALVWPDGAAGAVTEPESLPTMIDPGFSDPVELSRQANEYFARRQYDKAAEMYDRLLVFDPSNVNTYNNLGLTLHYLGRSSEALRKLNDGVAADPNDQRIWLTLGFVNSQIGNTEQARAALTKAVQSGSDETIRQSAMKMLDELP